MARCHRDLRNLTTVEPPGISSQLIKRVVPSVPIRPQARDFIAFYSMLSIEETIRGATSIPRLSGQEGPALKQRWPFITEGVITLTEFSLSGLLKPIVS